MALKNKTINKRTTKARGIYDKRGRSPKISIAFEPETFGRLAAMAKARGWPLAALVRHFVDCELNSLAGG